MFRCMYVYAQLKTIAMIREWHLQLIRFCITVAEGC